MRHCGSCQLCCTLPRVEEGVFSKRAGHRCEYQCDKGCAIYEDRPQVCRGFNCAWLLGANLPKPDECGYFVEPKPMLVHLDGTRVRTLSAWVDSSQPIDHHVMLTYARSRNCELIVHYRSEGT